MPTIYGLKPRFQRFLRPAVAKLAARGVTANQVTVAAVLLSVIMGLVLALNADSRWPYLLLPGVLFLRMALNAIDGILAREHGLQSGLGVVLNEMGDVASDLALYAPFVVVPGVNGVPLATFLILLVGTEMAGLVAIQIGTRRRYDGPMGKSDRAFAVGAVGLLLGVGIPAGAWLNAAFGCLAGLAAVTIVNRLRAALREVAP